MKRVSKNSIVSKKAFQNGPFSLTLQFRLSSLTKKRLQEKCYCKCSKIVANFPGEGLCYKVILSK